MMHRNLVRDLPPVSVLTFGAMRVNQEIDHAPGLLHALEQGITCIDTARAYGNSERIIGNTLMAWKGPTPFLCSKAMPHPGDWRQYCPLEQAFTPQSIRQDLETTLQRLQVEAIDLLYLHQWYALWTHRPEWLDTFRALKQEGKIQAFVDANQAAVAKGPLDPETFAAIRRDFVWSKNFYEPKFPPDPDAGQPHKET